MAMCCYLIRYTFHKGVLKINLQIPTAKLATLMFYDIKIGLNFA